MSNKLKEAEQAVRKTKNIQQEYIELNQLNWKTHDDLKHLQTNHEQIMWDYNKMEESNMQEQNTITSLEQTYQKFTQQHVATHVEFEKEKKTLIAQIQD